MSSAMGQSSFKFAAAKDRNDLTKELRELTTISSFKTKVFKYFSELDEKQHVCTVHWHFSFLCISVFLYII